jgi:hypothetical protein
MGVRAAREGVSSIDEARARFNAPPRIHVSGESTMDLTEAQIRQIIDRVQAALLKQARRNRRPGSAA